MKKVLIKNGTIVTATDEFKGDLLLADGKIAAIGGAIDASSADEVYDAEGKYECLAELTSTHTLTSHSATQHVLDGKALLQLLCQERQRS